MIGARGVKDSTRKPIHSVLCDTDLTEGSVQAGQAHCHLSYTPTQHMKFGDTHSNHSTRESKIHICFFSIVLKYRQCIFYYMSHSVHSSLH